MTEFEKLKAQKDAIIQRQRDEIEGLREALEPFAQLQCKGHEEGEPMCSQLAAMLEEGDLEGIEGGMEVCSTCAARNALSRPSDKEPEGWRPMSEAPKDGTWILGSFKHLLEKQEIHSIVWNEATQWWLPRFETEPTHWQPLPQPPSPEREG